jgi:hypothetical protein
MASTWGIIPAEDGGTRNKVKEKKQAVTISDAEPPRSRAIGHPLLAAPRRTILFHIRVAVTWCHGADEASAPKKI